MKFNDPATQDSLDKMADAVTSNIRNHWKKLKEKISKPDEVAEDDDKVDVDYGDEEQEDKNPESDNKEDEDAHM